MNQVKLTVAAIRTHCHPPGPDEKTATGKPIRERIYWDSQDRGFGLRVRVSAGGEINATFMLQRDLNGRSLKTTIGRLGAWTPDQARKRARELSVEIDKGLNPNEERRRERSRKITLADARQMHVDDMRARERSPVSIDSILSETDKYLPDWLKKPLIEITGAACRTRHKKLTEKHGIYIANRLMRHISACWNTAARIHSEMPPQSPTKAVALHKEHPRNNPIAWEDLPAWWSAVQEIHNPVRRDLQLFYLLTGLRNTDGKTVRWEHIDFEAGTIHRPMPKGGVDRAFTVPVSKFVLELLRRRHEENAVMFPDGDGGWVFPSRSRAGEVSHVREGRQQRYDKDGNKAKSLPSPHRLRHTFATAAHEAFLRELDLKILMNHARPQGNVTHGYIHASLGHLRDCAEKISEFLQSKAVVLKPEDTEPG